MKYHVRGLRERQDGWTPERQRAFLMTLAETGSVVRSVAAVGLGRASLYALRRNPAATGFAAAWKGALETYRARRRREPTALSRPVIRNGRIVAVRTVYRGAQGPVAMREITAAASAFFDSTLSASAPRATAGIDDAGAATLSTSAAPRLAPSPRVL